jgi:hypothetical protein
MTATLQIAVSETEDTLKIPSQALRFRPNGRGGASAAAQASVSSNTIWVLDGNIVIKRDVNPGQTVAVTLEARTLFKVAHDLREMEVRGRIDEADVGKLSVGQITNAIDWRANLRPFAVDLGLIKRESPQPDRCSSENPTETASKS